MCEENIDIEFKELRLYNWKSYTDSTLYIDPLTFIVGTNASGKSNILDALDFLNRCAQGQTIENAANAIRGGMDWLCHKGSDNFKLISVFEYFDQDIEYILNCQRTEKTLEIIHEELATISKAGKRTILFATNDDNISPGSAVISTSFYQAKRGKRKSMDINRQCILLTQLDNVYTIKEVKDKASIVCQKLKDIFILSPIPDNMRVYSPLSIKLNRDGSNIAGVLAGMEVDQQKLIEETIIKYVKKLPEKDLLSIHAEKAGVFLKEAVLCCEEQWTPGHIDKVDAKGMSDGTLRFAAIALALLMVKEGSLLVVEEIDNGLHPSRVSELVEMLKELSALHHIDVLCTTHNPALVDRLGPSMIPFISYVTRNTENGSSHLKLLEEKANLAKLMARFSAGDLMINNKL